MVLYDTQSTDAKDQREDVAIPTQSQDSEPRSLNVKFNEFSFRSLFLLGYVTLKRRYPQMEALCHLNEKGNF